VHYKRNGGRPAKVSKRVTLEGKKQGGLDITKGEGPLDLGDMDKGRLKLGADKTGRSRGPQGDYRRKGRQKQEKRSPEILWVSLAIKKRQVW